jgi:hypothetical protein
MVVAKMIPSTVQGQGLQVLEGYPRYRLHLESIGPIIPVLDPRAVT